MARRYPRRPNPHDELRLVRGTLYTPDEVIPLRQIGKGAFSVAYTEKTPTPGRRSRVFVVSGDNIYDKELLAMAHDDAPKNPHLPKVERFGHTHDKAVFVMPLYKSPLRKDDDPVGWRDYLALKKCRDAAYAPAYGGPYKKGRSGYEINEAVYECAEASGVRPSLLEALRVLIDTASNYSAEYVFEFSPRNLATDEGRLVLLDVLYDREALVRQREAAMKRRVGNVWNPRPGAVPLRKNHDYDPSWDYDVRSRPLADVVAAVSSARSIAGMFAELLGMEPPTVHYVSDTGDHLARYVNGTSSRPVVVINDRALAKSAKKYRVSLRDTAESTLLHEMGHAYVDSVGLSGELDDEESIVEEPAAIFFRSMDIETAAKWLRAEVDRRMED